MNNSDPLVHIKPDVVLNEYHQRLAGLMGENIRLSCTIRVLNEELSRSAARISQLESEKAAHGWQSDGSEAISNRGETRVYPEAS